MKWLLLTFLLAAACGGADSALPGDNAEEIHEWLHSGEYLSFEAETVVRPGLVRGGRRVFVNALAADALAVGTVAPIDAIAVRELYDDDLTTLTGWGFSRQTRYGVSYYETFDLVDRTGHHTFGTDVRICGGCHEVGLRSEWPLR